MLTLFAQVTEAISPEATNPASWAALVKELGISGFCVLVLAVLVGALLWNLFKNPSNARQLRESEKRARVTLNCIRELAEISKICAKGLSPEAVEKVAERTERMNRIICEELDRTEKD
jgi:peptidoglycan/LPS O-acetylase OafA/YrhL